MLNNNLQHGAKPGPERSPACLQALDGNRDQGAHALANVHDDVQDSNLKQKVGSEVIQDYDTSLADLKQSTRMGNVLGAEANEMLREGPGVPLGAAEGSGQTQQKLALKDLSKLQFQQQSADQPKQRCQKNTTKLVKGTSAGFKRRRGNSYADNASWCKQQDEESGGDKMVSEGGSDEEVGYGGDKAFDGHDNMDSMSNDSGMSSQSQGSTARKINQIEKKIRSSNLSKRERRLLQNRKSALKCRLKKQDQLEKLKVQVDRLSAENRQLKEKISAQNALLQCKNDENDSLNKKYNDLQFQQTLILASYLTQNGVPVSNLAGQQNQEDTQSLLQKQLAQLSTSNAVIQPNDVQQENGAGFSGQAEGANAMSVDQTLQENNTNDGQNTIQSLLQGTNLAQQIDLIVKNSQANIQVDNTASLSNKISSLFANPQGAFVHSKSLQSLLTAQTSGQQQQNNHQLFQSKQHDGNKQPQNVSFANIGNTGCLAKEGDRDKEALFQSSPMMTSDKYMSWLSFRGVNGITDMTKSQDLQGQNLQANQASGLHQTSQISTDPTTQLLNQLYQNESLRLSHQEGLNQQQLASNEDALQQLRSQLFQLNDAKQQQQQQPNSTNFIGCDQVMKIDCQSQQQQIQNSKSDQSGPSQMQPASTQAVGAERRAAYKVSQRLQHAESNHQFNQSQIDDVDNIQELDNRADNDEPQFQLQHHQQQQQSSTAYVQDDVHQSQYHRQKQQNQYSKYASDGNLIRDHSAVTLGHAQYPNGGAIAIAGADLGTQDPRLNAGMVGEARVPNEIKISKSFGNYMASRNFEDGSQNQQSIKQNQDDIIKQLQWQAQLQNNNQQMLQDPLRKGFNSLDKTIQEAQEHFEQQKQQEINQQQLNNLLQKLASGDDSSPNLNYLSGDLQSIMLLMRQQQQQQQQQKPSNICQDKAQQNIMQRLSLLQRANVMSQQRTQMAQPDPKQPEGASSNTENKAPVPLQPKTLVNKLASWTSSNQPAKASGRAALTSLSNNLGAEGKTYEGGQLGIQNPTPNRPGFTTFAAARAGQIVGAITPGRVTQSPGTSAFSQVKKNQEDLKHMQTMNNNQ